MARADLHYALALDTDIHQASQVDPSLLDPIVRVEGALPGTARPVTVIREYQGPQGAYTESFVLRDRRGREVYRSVVRRIQLTGEMFEDRFTDTIRGLRIEDAEEHTLTFLIADEDVGSIPVFIEAGQGGDPYVAVEQAVTKALQKGSIAWLSLPQAPRRRGRRGPLQTTRELPVWYVFEGGKVYVLTGPTEQQVPGLTDSRQVELLVRSKEDRSRIARVRTDVRLIAGDDPQFDRIGRTALGKRLNLPDGDGALERWRGNCSLVELTLRFRPDGTEPDAGAATPAPDVASAEMILAENAADKQDSTSAKDDDIHVEAEVDQEVFDQLIAEGKSERVARAKAKAAFVKREKARIRAERETASA